MRSERRCLWNNGLRINNLAILYKINNIGIYIVYNKLSMNNSIFEEIKHVNEYDSEYWKAREMYKILEYSEYNKFVPVINKAKQSCENAWQRVEEHFADVSDMVEVGSWASRQIDDILLSRYGCYLIIQNADPRKEVVALGQTYFAIQTRKQEVHEELLEDNKRKHLRDEMKKHNIDLAEAAKNAGVIEPVEYAVFQNFWYMWLYAGLDSKWIHTKKWLKKSQRILDHMWSEELAANLFRATQAEAKLKRENIRWKDKANKAHLEVGKEVRDTIGKLWGTMPEKLPVVDSIKKFERRLKKSNK